MTVQSLIEIKESDIRKHYAQAYQLLSGFDYAPRVRKGRGRAPTTRGRSPGIPGRRRFRSTTPGLSTPSAQTAGVSLAGRIQAVDDEDRCRASPRPMCCAARGGPSRWPRRWSRSMRI